MEFVCLQFCKKMNKKLTMLIFLAFILRIFAIIILGRHINPELWEYDDIAINLIQQKAYVIKHLNTVYRSFGYPFYSFFSAFFHLLTKRNYLALEIIQIILSVASCFLIYLIAKRIFNKKVALLSLFMTATHPGLIVYTTKIHELTLVVFFVLLIFLLITSLNYDKIRNNIIIGILMGVGILTRPSIIFFVPLYFIYLWLSRQKLRNIFKAWLITSLAAFLLILPWTLRNYNLHKRWIFITTNSAEHFWRGNNALASGSSLTRDGLSILEASPKDLREQIYKMNEIEQYDFFHRETFRFIKSNPLFFIKMVFKKFFYFWWFSPQAGKTYPALWSFIYKSYYGTVLLFFIIGFYLTVSKRKGTSKAAIVLVLSLFISISLLHSFFYIEIRHRWAIEALMLIFSAYGFIMLLEQNKRINNAILQRNA